MNEPSQLKKLFQINSKTDNLKQLIVATEVIRDDLVHASDKLARNEFGVKKQIFFISPFLIENGTAIEFVRFSSSDGLENTGSMFKVKYILENGTDAYFNWIDEKSWHPFGRNVSETSQVTLHLTAASLYPIFNFGSSVYDFTIVLPLVFGSLTAIVVFAFIRVLGGTTAGLFAALIFSISIPIFTRGLIGWFKSEPLGLFFAFLAMYLFVSGLKFNKGKISLIEVNSETPN